MWNECQKLKPGKELTSLDQYLDQIVIITIEESSIGKKNP